MKLALLLLLSAVPAFAQFKILAHSPSVTSPTMIEFAQGDDVSFDEYLTYGDEYPVSLGDPTDTFETQMLSFVGSSVVVPNSAHVVVEGSIGMVNISFSSGLSQMIAPAQYKDIVTKVTHSGLSTYYRGRILNVDVNEPLQ